MEEHVTALLHTIDELSVALANEMIQKNQALTRLAEVETKLEEITKDVESKQ